MSDEIISTKFRISLRTTERLKAVLLAIEDIEGISMTDNLHELYRDKLMALQEMGDIDLPQEAMIEIKEHFDLISMID